MVFFPVDYNKLFSREAIKQRLKENVLKTAKQLARNSINEILKQYPCMPSDVSEMLFILVFMNTEHIVKLFFHD